MTAAEREAALAAAREGDAEARGKLLDSYRAYLRRISQAVRKGRLSSRLDDSDLIQDTLLEAHRNFTSFRGTTLEELAAWLRQIAVHTAGHQLRAHLEVGKRDAAREQPADGLADGLIAADSSPSARAIRHERSAQVTAALERLPEDMQRVLLGRFLENQPYAVLAIEMGRSAGAVRMLYLRALERLREECQADTDVQIPP